MIKSILFYAIIFALFGIVLAAIISPKGRKDGCFPSSNNPEITICQHTDYLPPFYNQVLLITLPCFFGGALVGGIIGYIRYGIYKNKNAGVVQR